jgi:hypothetical protein
MPLAKVAAAVLSLLCELKIIQISTRFMAGHYLNLLCWRGIVENK